ncbi:hypothetical protein [Nitratireductor basaltis]|uniref:Uncharacterized protein n=1 Tax=Nitratireductor basaltis TaxID=472175 RepID=A0A084UA06_9HYPH|nr:hypothetical protein [Nitratireductor basaltis]KFB09792.1 hypothetical protein EL18_00811 [Nitratireductor basaltis]
MRTFHGTQGAIAALIIISGFVAPSQAEQQYIINQNQTGITLPGVVVPNGYDEVRAADGTSCRSSVAASGAYVDSGVIGGGLDDSGSNTLSAYGRVVVPLGQRPRRLNCDKLYQLELERLQLEVKMLKRGLDPRLGTAATDNPEWAQDDGWTNEGRR